MRKNGSASAVFMDYIGLYSFILRTQIFYLCMVMSLNDVICQCSRQLSSEAIRGLAATDPKDAEVLMQALRDL